MNDFHSDLGNNFPGNSGKMFRGPDRKMASGGRPATLQKKMIKRIRYVYDQETDLQRNV